VDELRPADLETKQDRSGMPQLGGPVPERIHPADYLVWPQPKGLKLGKMYPERTSAPEASAPAIKRFGPGRAGLQPPRRKADGLASA
jgi:hypothetical protein